MKKNFRKAVFIVTYAKYKGRILYLILKRYKHWHGWEFTKGGVEQGESLIHTVKREVFEESGKKCFNIKDHHVSGNYLYKRQFPDRPGYKGQEYRLFSSEIKFGKIKIDENEHNWYRWLKFKNAEKKLTFNNQKQALKIVNDYLLSGK